MQEVVQEVVKEQRRQDLAEEQRKARRGVAYQIRSIPGTWFTVHPVEGRSATPGV